MKVICYFRFGARNLYILFGRDFRYVLLANNMNNMFKSRFRFNNQFDLHLAQEVLGQNPYENPKRWQIIQVNMVQITGQSVSVRTLRDRIHNLVKKYLETFKQNEGR